MRDLLGSRSHRWSLTLDDKKPEIVRVPLRRSLESLKDHFVEKRHEALTIMHQRTRTRMPYPPDSGKFPIGDWAAARAQRQE